MEVLDTFGLDPLLLAAQIVNFLILLFILKRFFYKPILKMLDTRRDKIALSLKNAEEIEKRLQAVEAERDKKIRKAAEEARSIIKEATASAQGIIAQAHKKAESDIEKMIKKSEEAMALEREQLHKEIRAELAELVIAGLRKVTEKSFDEKDKKELVEKTLKGLA